jgi:hypothetical protein
MIDIRTFENIDLPSWNILYVNFIINKHRW